MNRTRETRHPRVRRAGIVAALLLPAAPAFAHDEYLSLGLIWAEPDAWVVQTSLDPYATETFFAGKTEDPYYRLNMENLEPVEAILEEAAKGFFKVEADGKVLEPKRSDFSIELDNCYFRVRYPRVGEGRLELAHQFLDRMIEGHRTVVDVVGLDGQVRQSIVFSADRLTATAAIIGEVPEPPASADPGLPTTTSQVVPGYATPGGSPAPAEAPRARPAPTPEEKAAADPPAVTAAEPIVAPAPSASPNVAGEPPPKRQWLLPVLMGAAVAATAIAWLLVNGKSVLPKAPPNE